MLLTKEQLGRRDHLESTIRTNRKAFLLVCEALREIYEDGLWKQTHTRFGDYCHERLGLSHNIGLDLIAHARIIEDLRLTCPGMPLPGKVYHSTLLKPLSSEERAVVWRESVGNSGGETPGGAVIKEAKSRLNELMELSSALTGNGRQELIDRVRHEEGAAAAASQQATQHRAEDKVSSALRRGLESLAQLIRMCRRIDCAEEAEILEEVLRKMKERLTPAVVEGASVLTPVSCSA